MKRTHYKAQTRTARDRAIDLALARWYAAQAARKAAKR